MWSGSKCVTCATTPVSPRLCTAADDARRIVQAIRWVASKFNRLLGMDRCNTEVACVLGRRLCLSLGSAAVAAIESRWGMRSTTFMLLWIAHKLLDDNPVSNKSIPTVWDCMAPDATGCRTIAQWTALEASVLGVLDWRTHVTAAQTRLLGADPAPPTPPTMPQTYKLGAAPAPSSPRAT